MEFIKSVEDAKELCSDNGLQDYALRIVLNEKILGDAKRCVLRLGNNMTWEEAKAELRLHFRPRKDYSELINECRNVKVGNLRELFEIVKSVNYQLNELYSFEEEEARPINYSPQNNDRYLVGIIMEKMDNLVRGNVNKNSNLIEIHNKLAKLKLLDDERAVSIAHRKIKNFSETNNHNRQTNRQTNRPNGNDETYLHRQHNHYNNNNNNPNNNFNFNNRQNSNGNYSNNYNNNTVNRNNSNYHRNNSNNSDRRNVGHNSGRFNNSNRSCNNYNNYNINNNPSNDHGVEPMEIENVQKQNFSTKPQNANYP